MTRILIPVDAGMPARTQAALAEAVRLHALSPVEVHLLNVQPLLTRHVEAVFGAGELQALQRAAGHEDLAPAKAVLDQHRVPYTASVRIGRSAETIARAAGELDCDQIVLGDGAAAQGLTGRLFGSLAHQLRQMIGATGGHCQVIGA